MPDVVDRPVSIATRRVFLAVVVAQVGIVITGGLVRLTGSGLGCPSWPECAPGSYVPVREQAEGYHKYVEFGNRTLTFVVTAVIVAGVVAALRHRPRRRPLVLLALVQLLGVAAQAVLGGITVLTGLHPATVAAHFLLSMALIAAAVTLYERSGEGDAAAVPLVRHEIRLLGVGLAIVTAAVVTLGTLVTGSGPHSGDEAASRFGLDPRTVAWVHADLVWLLVGLSVAMVLALALTGGPQAARRRAHVLVLVLFAQGTVGYVQYATDLPVPLVTLHMLGACLVVVAVTRLILGLRTRPSVVPQGRAPLAHYAAR